MVFGGRFCHQLNVLAVVVLCFIFKICFKLAVETLWQCKALCFVSVMSSGLTFYSAGYYVEQLATVLLWKTGKSNCISNSIFCVRHRKHWSGFVHNSLSFLSSAPNFSIGCSINTVYPVILLCLHIFICFYSPVSDYDNHLETLLSRYPTDYRWWMYTVNKAVLIDP